MPNNTESNRPDSTFPEIRIVGDWPADFDEERALGHSPTAVRLSVHGHVETISTLLWKQAARLYFSDPREGRAFDKALGEIKGDTLAFQVSYPLKKIVEVHVRPLAWGKTHSVESILWEIANAYRVIYEKEKESVGEEKHARRAGTLLNRGKTNGPYGIWGHDITDLHFETLFVDTANKRGEIHVGS